MLVRKLVKSLFVVVVMPILLISCVTWSDIKKGAQNFKGQHINQVIAKIGLPDSEQNIAGRKIYIFSDQHAETFSYPVMNQSRGFIGMTPVVMSSTSFEEETYNFQCVLKLVVNKKEVIIDEQIEGNIGGCQKYAKYAPDKQMD